MIVGILSLLFWLSVGHALADFTFQTDVMSKGKNRNRPVDLTEVPPGQKYQVSWFYWLTAHALIHGGTVALITGSVGLGAAETICHWLIDFGKCENKYGIHVDQVLHFLCKLLWTGILVVNVLIQYSY